MPLFVLAFVFSCRRLRTPPADFHTEAATPEASHFCVSVSGSVGIDSCRCRRRCRLRRWGRLAGAAAAARRPRSGRCWVSQTPRHECTAVDAGTFEPARRTRVNRWPVVPQGGRPAAEPLLTARVHHCRHAGAAHQARRARAAGGCAPDAEATGATCQSVPVPAGALLTSLAWPLLLLSGLQLGGSTRDLFYYPDGTVQVTVGGADVVPGQRVPGSQC